jgi:hypothetical protein
MKAAFPRGTGICATLFLVLPIAAQESQTPTAPHPRSSATRTPSGVTPTPAQTPEAPPPDAGLMKPAPTPRFSSTRAPHPLAETECGGAGWRAFTAPRFKSRKACETWVRENLQPGGAKEFVFPQPRADGGAKLRLALPFLI